MSVEQLKIIFKPNTIGFELAPRGIQAVFRKRGVPLTDFTCRDEIMSLPSVLLRLGESKRKAFDFTGQGFEFLGGPVANYHLDFLLIKSASTPAISWDDWAAEFTNNPNFVMAWVVDSEYDYWQNAEDPLQYTAMSKPSAHLPIKSNGLPYPLEKKIIDTSANPGRWRFHKGYLEAVGAMMWLGTSFWSLTGADQTQVENTPWLRISHLLPSVTKLEAAEHSFTTAEGDSGELQSKLRSLLFPAQVV